MAKIVISYRRQDSEAITGRIRDRLAKQYGDDSIFMDIDSIPFGADFRDHIGEALSETDMLVAVIGPKWTGIHKGGRSRIREENDPVRIEVEKALERRIPVIPILVNNATMPKTDELPERLKELSYRNAATVDSGRDFHQHMDRLIRSIDQILVSRAKQPAAAEPEAVNPAALLAAAEKPAPAADPPDSASKTSVARASETPPADVAVTRAAVTIPVGTDDTPSTIPTPRPSPKRSLAVAIGMAVCVMIVSAGGYLYWKRLPDPAPIDDPIKRDQAQNDHPADRGLSAIAAFDTRCKREDGSAFYDDFKSPDRGWGPAGTNYYFNDGQMVLKAKEDAIEPHVYWPLLFKNATICTEITTPSDLKKADGSAAAGIAFWASDSQNYYISIIYPDGTYAAFRRIAGGWSTIVPRTKADAIRAGANAVNQMKVATGNNVASLFVNGVKLVDVWGQPLARGGSAGPFAQSEADVRNEWKFSSIAVARTDDATAPSAKALVPAADVALLDACKPKASVAFFDDFNPRNPGWYATGGTHSFKDGRLVFKPKPKTNAEVFYPSLIFKTATICIDIKSPSDSKPSGGGSGNVIFWASDYRNYYSVSVYKDGTYDIFRRVDGRWEQVRPRAGAPSIRQESGAVNRVKIAFDGDMATVIVNDANLIQFRGQPASSGGFLGVSADTDADAENEWTFLNVTVMVDDKPTPPTSRSVSPAATAAASACNPSSTSIGLFDDFKSADPGWGKVGDDNNFRDGRMVLRSKNVSPRAWIYTPLVFKSATICADFISPSVLEKVDGSAAGGVIFWAADYRNYYVAEVYADGTYDVYRKLADKWISVRARTKADGIRQGPNAVNHMRVTTAGDIVTLFVNGQKLVDLWGQSPKLGGAIGLFGQSEANQEEEWRFSNIVVLDDMPAQPNYPAGAAAISAKCDDKASLAFFDDFKSLDPGWGSPTTSYFLQNGALNMKPAADRSSSLIYFPLVFTAATVCSEIMFPSQVDKPADSGAAGIMFWAVDYNNYYVALLYADGTYFVSRRIDGEWVDVAARAKASMINQGPDAVNRMKVIVKLDTATILINDTIAIGFRGQPPDGGTAFGLYAQSPASQEYLWRFTNMSVLN